MAKIPTTRRFSVEDFSAQKSWIEKLIGPLNQFIIAVVTSLTNQLTFTENMAAQIKTVRVKTATSSTVGSGGLPNYVSLLEPVVFLSTLKTGCVGLWVIRAENAQSQETMVYAVWPFWSQNGNQITISALSGLSPSSEYNVTILAIAG